MSFNLLLALLLTSPAFGQSSSVNPKIASLRGLQAMGVKVSISSINAFPEDPSEKEMQSYVEKRLQAVGIKLLSPGELQSEVLPLLEVTIDFNNMDKTTSQMTLLVSLRQDVSLKRDRSISTSASTWMFFSVANSWSATNNKRESIARGLELFICDFARANPAMRTPRVRAKKTFAFPNRRDDCRSVKIGGYSRV